MLCSAHTFIWPPISFVPPHRKQLIELYCMPCNAHVTKIQTMFDASVITNILHLFDDFLHHRLRLLHRTQFHRRVSDRSVALAASCSSVAMTLLCLMLVTLGPSAMISDLNRLWYHHYIHVLDLILQVIVTHYVL